MDNLSLFASSEHPHVHGTTLRSDHLVWDRCQVGALPPDGYALQQRAKVAVWDHWQVGAGWCCCLLLAVLACWNEMSAAVSTLMFRYLAQVMNLSFVREAHVKKYKKLMKLDLPAELQSLRWDPKYHILHAPLQSYYFQPPGLCVGSYFTFVLKEIVTKVIENGDLTDLPDLWLYFWTLLQASVELMPKTALGMVNSLYWHASKILIWRWFVFSIRWSTFVPGPHSCPCKVHPGWLRLRFYLLSTKTLLVSSNR